MAIGTGAAILGSAVLGVGSSIMGSKAAAKSGDAATDANLLAAQLQSEATDKTIASNEKMFNLSREDQNRMYDLSREDLAPWRTAGTNALTTLQDKMAAGPGSFDPTKDPGYQFGYSEFVEKPTLAMASATGKLRSGATQKALARYASDYASTKYDNFLSRYYDTLKPYQSLAGVGQTAANQQVAANQSTAAGLTSSNQALAGGTANALMSGASSQGNYISNAGASRASGYINQANAQMGGINNASNALLAYGLYNSPTLPTSAYGSGPYGASSR